MTSIRTRIAAITVGSLGLVLPLSAAAPAMAGTAPTDDPSHTQPVTGNWIGSAPAELEPGESTKLPVPGTAEAPKFTGNSAIPAFRPGGARIHAEIQRVRGEGTAEDPNVVVVELTNVGEKTFEGVGFQAEFTG